MSTADPAYFDYAAFTPTLDLAAEAWSAAAAACGGNPSSLHAAGTQARRMLREAKTSICAGAGVSDARLLLCSGATEANNTVLRSAMETSARARLLLAPDVHPSIWWAVDAYPGRVDVLSGLANGRVTRDALAAAIVDDTALVCLSHACNETGITQDLAPLAECCEQHGVRMLCDGAQALGRLALTLDDVPCDFYTFSAYKFGGAPGVGGIFIRSADMVAMIKGGNQEFGLRAGTENVPGAAAAAAALEYSVGARDAESVRLRELARIFTEGLSSRLSDLTLNSVDDALPGLVSVSIAGIKGRAAVAALSVKGFAVSSGSACHADTEEPSRVILALGRSSERALGTLRVSMGRGTTEAATRALADEIVSYVDFERRSAGA